MIATSRRAIAGRIVITPTRPESTLDNAMQSSSFKRRIIAEATKDGSLHELRWFIEFRAPVRTLPPHLRPAGALTGPRVLAAAHPGKWIPVVPVAPDPVESQAYAELLLECIRTKNRGRGFELNVALTDAATLADGYRWYEWGERIPVFDEVCATCGGVGACACSDGRLALVCGGGRTHISRGGEKALCGRSVRAAGVVEITPWERRRWAGLDLCGNCRRAWERRVDR